MFDQSEFTDRYAGRYFGKYRGMVHAVDDPKKDNRIKAIVPVILGTKEPVGWARPSPPSGGGVNDGYFWPPSVGDFVWIEFEEGDPQRPIWSPGPSGGSKGSDGVVTPRAVKHGRGTTDDTDAVVRNFDNISPSQFSGVYGDVRMIKSKSGHFLEFDDTSGEERLQLSHRTGTRLEMIADGGIQEVIAASSSRRVAGKQSVYVKGLYELDVSANRSLRVGGNLSETVEGDTTRTYRNLTRTGGVFSDRWESNYDVSVGGSWRIAAGAQGSLSTGGGFSCMVGQNLQATVLENLELVSSNASNIIPIANSMLLHAYNGNLELKATDPTGLVSKAVIQLKGNLPLANIALGGELAVNPLVLGIPLSTLLTKIIIELATHMHPTAAPGSPSPPATAAVTSAMAAEVPLILSQFIYGM